MPVDPKRRPEPDLMVLFLRHCAVGFAGAALFVSVLLTYDVARIGSLVAGSDQGQLAVFLLWVLHGTVFGSVQFAISLMLAARDDDDDDDFRGGRMIPIPVRVRAGGRR
jgi:hypothetical protein